MSYQNIFIVDPLKTLAENSHHDALYNFFNHYGFSIDILNLYLSPSYTSSENIIIKQIYKIKVFIAILINCILIIIYQRKKIKNNFVFFPNMDWISSMIFLFARKVRLIRCNFIFRTIGIKDILTLNGFSKNIIRKLYTTLLMTGDRFSAETLNLQSNFQNFLQSKYNVSHTPFPGFVYFAQHVFPKTGTHFLFVGNPRSDKGYLDVLRIAESYPKLNFRIQLPNEKSLISDWISLILCNRKNITFFAKPSSELQILLEISQSIAVFLPYSIKKFRDRGSSIFTACVLMNKPIISSSLTSFKNESKKYGTFINISSFSGKNEIVSDAVLPNYRYMDYILNQWRYLFR